MPEYTAGVDLGYFIWYDASGWHIRWSGDGALHDFTGTITTPGFISSFTAVDFEFPGDTWSMPNPSTLTFTATEDIGEDGFDITIVASNEITFDIYLDGVHIKEKVFIGEKSANPVDIPFTLVAKARGTYEVPIIHSRIVNSNRGIVSNRSSIMVNNCTISSSSLYDFYLESGSHVISLNTTFDKSLVYFDDALSTLEVQWFMHIYVQYSDLTPAPVVDVWVNNSKLEQIFAGITNPDAYAKWNICTEYVQDSTEKD